MGCWLFLCWPIRATLPTQQGAHLLPGLILQQGVHVQDAGKGVRSCQLYPGVIPLLIAQVANGPCRTNRCAESLGLTTRCFTLPEGCHRPGISGSGPASAPFWVSSPSSVAGATWKRWDPSGVSGNGFLSAGDQPYNLVLLEFTPDAVWWPREWGWAGLRSSLRVGLVGDWDPQGNITCHVTLSAGGAVHTGCTGRGGASDHPLALTSTWQCDFIGQSKIQDNI